VGLDFHTNEGIKMKFHAPKGCNEANIGGQNFQVNEHGHIETPDHGDYASLLAPHGFVPVVDDVEVEEKAAAPVTNKGNRK
jgi:hypothetical protein